MRIRSLLPIGSVVLNKDADKRLMVIGVLVENCGKKYDYLAVTYPEGYADAEHLYVFNHEDIASVEFLGYINSEFQLFRGSLAKAFEQTEPEEENS